MTAKTVSINILGNEYVIKGDVDSQTTRSVAHYVENQIVQAHNKNATQNKLKTAILSNMNIAGELFESQKAVRRLESEEQECNRAIDTLVNRIDSVLDDNQM